MRYIFSTLFLILPLVASATDCDTVYSIKDSLVTIPHFKDESEDEIKRFYAQSRFNMQVAKPAPIFHGMRDGKARVILSFDVDKTGTVSNPSILRIARQDYDEFDKFYREKDPHWATNIDEEYCKEEAIRILTLMPFSPAMKEGKPVCFEKLVTIITVFYAAGGYD